MDVPVCQTGLSSFWSMHNETVCSAEPSSAKMDALIFEIGGSGISRVLNKASRMMTADPNDWRTPLVHYLENPDHITDRKV
jgi:hypothetical protein